MRLSNQESLRNKFQNFDPKSKTDAFKNFDLGLSIKKPQIHALYTEKSLASSSYEDSSTDERESDTSSSDQQ